MWNDDHWAKTFVLPTRRNCGTWLWGKNKPPCPEIGSHDQHRGKTTPSCPDIGSHDQHRGITPQSCTEMSSFPVVAGKDVEGECPGRGRK